MQTATSEGNSIVVFSFPKSDDEKIQFALREYQGRYYVDLRLWFQKDGDYRPSKKGLSFSTALMPQLEQGVRHLGKAVQAAPSLGGSKKG